MKGQSNGISKYESFIVDIYFPEGDVCCDLCPILETQTRKQCRRTGEYLLNTKCVGFYCPLKKHETEDLKDGFDNQ